MRNERAWPLRCWKNRSNGSNIVVLRFGDHGTKEMLGVVGWKVWPVSNFAQQQATTCNRVCKGTQHVTSNNVGSCWPTMLRPFARGVKLPNVTTSGGSRRRARGARLPPFFLDQTEARRAEKNFFETGRPPYLKVWIRHWKLSISLHFYKVG